MVTRSAVFLILCCCLWGLMACGNAAPAVPPRELTLHALDIKFDVTTLKVKVHQPVKLTYINQGTIDHAFAIAGLVDEQKVKPGQQQIFTFTPSEVGTFKYRCVMPGHEAAGMVGTLVVEP